MKIIAVVLLGFIGCCVCTEKGISSMPYYGDMGGGYGGGGYGGGYSHVSYAPVYHQKAVEAYPYDLPQYSFKNDFKTYMPIVKYVPVQSVPYYGPTQAFYPASYGGGGYGGGY